jgi:hypothetical protein
MGLRDTLVYWNDFINDVDYSQNADGWTETNIGATPTGTLGIRADTALGVLQVQAGEANGEGYHVQFTQAGAAGEFMLPAAGTIITVEFRATSDAWAADQWFLGLAPTSAVLMDTNGDMAAALDNTIGFHYNVDDDAALAGNPNYIYNPTILGEIELTTNTDGNAVRRPPAPTDGTYRTFGLRVEGVGGGSSNIQWYIDDVRMATGVLAAAVPLAATEVCISMAHVAGAAATNSLDIDWVLATQTR